MSSSNLCVCFICFIFDAKFLWSVSHMSNVILLYVDWHLLLYHICTCSIVLTTYIFLYSIADTIWNWLFYSENPLVPKICLDFCPIFHLIFVIIKTYFFVLDYLANFILTLYRYFCENYQYVVLCIQSTRYVHKHTYLTYGIISLL